MTLDRKIEFENDICTHTETYYALEIRIGFAAHNAFCRIVVNIFRVLEFQFEFGDAGWIFAVF